MWTTEFILSQVCVLIGMIMIAISYFIKNKKWILLLNCMASAVYCVEYLLLGAYTGAILNVIGIARCIWYYIDELNDKKQNIVSIIVVAVVSLIAGIWTARLWVDAVAILSVLLLIYALWQPNIKFYRYSSVICSICWLVYNVCIGSILAIFTESIMLVFGVVGIVNLYTHNLVKNEQKQN